MFALIEYIYIFKFLTITLLIALFHINHQLRFCRLPCLNTAFYNMIQIWWDLSANPQPWGWGVGLDWGCVCYPQVCMGIFLLLFGKHLASFVGAKLVWGCVTPMFAGAFFVVGWQIFCPEGAKHLASFVQGFLSSLSCVGGGGGVYVTLS